MSIVDHPNVEHYAHEHPAVFNHHILKQNWTSGILREEAAMLDELMTGRRRAPMYVTDTETQREFNNPKSKSIEHMKHIEANRLGRRAYVSTQKPPQGILPTFNDRAYPEVIPRFHLPKMPY